MQNPPGGPPDFTAPTLLSVTPDSGTVNPGLRDPMWFEFDEVISEQSGGRGGGLEKIFVISPRPKEIKVSWKRKRIGVRPREGWLPDAVYQVRLKKGVADLSNNRTTWERLIVVSTGGDIPATVVAGKALDWQDRRAASGASIEVMRLPDSLAYTAAADSAGDFRLVSIPRGHYRVLAFLDQNRNDRRERVEAYDSLEIDVDSAVAVNFWLAQRDTVGPRLRKVTPIDSVTFSVEFSQPLDTVPLDVEVVTVLALPDSVAVPVSAVVYRSVYDSVQAVLRQAADSAARADTAAADTTGQQQQQQPQPRIGPQRPAQPAGEETADTSEVGLLLEARPRLATELVVQMVNPLGEGTRYIVLFTVRNLLRAGGEVRGALNMPEPVAKDSL